MAHLVHAQLRHLHLQQQQQPQQQQPQQQPRVSDARGGSGGIDGRCLANLLWALAKLDLAPADSAAGGGANGAGGAGGASSGGGGCALSTEIAACAAPLVLRALPTFTPQGLANALWSLSKLPPAAAPPDVVAALAGRIAAELTAALRATPRDAGPFDAQALSNSVW